MKALPPVILRVSTIWRGTFLRFGEPTPFTRETLPRYLKNYILEPAQAEVDSSPSLTYTLGESFSVDANGDRRSKSLHREALNLLAADEEQRRIEEALAADPDEQTKAALELVQQDADAHTALQIAEGRALARERELADEAARAALAEEDELLAVNNHHLQVTPAVEEIAEPAPQSEEWSPPQPKPKRRMRKRFVRRGPVWMRTKQIKHFRIGEKVYVKNQTGEFESIGVVGKHGKPPAAYIEET